MVLMHAVARIVLHRRIANIQASWTKMGRSGVSQLLAAGVNDLGGTLMNKSISRAAGTRHGQELPPEDMDELIRQCVVSRSREQLCMAGLSPTGSVVPMSLRTLAGGAHDGTGAGSKPRLRRLISISAKQRHITCSAGRQRSVAKHCCRDDADHRSDDLIVFRCQL
ncbi:MAG: hypothetical protein CM1200mP20_09700 [Pseudomonadota bacterium]|nr:MAG: hypothetical protein CM1200mP20_09700 [Pseudomonadota bacterium]